MRLGGAKRGVSLLMDDTAQVVARFRGLILDIAQVMMDNCISTNIRLVKIPHMNEYQQSKIDFRRLVGELVGMYSADTLDVVISELVANALDAKAQNVWLTWDSLNRVLTIEDDGNGMTADQFRDYHDFAVGLKERGSGIGFAGLGAKMSFEIADRVETLSRKGEMIRGSDWRWNDVGYLSWREIPSPALDHHGTKVEVHIAEKYDVASINPGRLKGALKRDYLPLFINEFLQVYSDVGIYSRNLRFHVNGSVIEPEDLDSAFGLVEKSENVVLNGKQAVGLGVIGTLNDDFQRMDLRHGILLCTYGKVIKAELFGLPTGLLGDRLFGIFEVPGLIEFLTSNKTDLREQRGRGRPLAKLTDQVRNHLKDYLESRGVTFADRKRGALSARLERELKDIVGQLPELQDFRGTRRQVESLKPDDQGKIRGSTTTTPGNTETNESGSNGSNEGGGSDRQRSRLGTADINGPIRGRRRKSERQRGPQVAFEDQPARGEVSWIDGDVITINSGHSAYRNRLSSDSARLTYCMFAIAIALERSGILSESDEDRYVESFMSAWGSS